MKINKQILVALVLIIIHVVSRKISFGPEGANFSPILAIALFSGFKFKNYKLGWLTPLVAMLITDIIFEIQQPGYGFYGVSQVINYAAYLVIVMLGSIIKENNIINSFAFGTAAAILFYIITNTGTWLEPNYTMYEKNWQGLQNCLIMGIPFFKNTMLSTIIFTSVLFLVEQLATRKVFKNQIA
jgi:hypothetical protein